MPMRKFESKTKILKYWEQSRVGSAQLRFVSQEKLCWFGWMSLERWSVVTPCWRMTLTETEGWTCYPTGVNLYVRGEGLCCCFIYTTIMNQNQKKDHVNTHWEKLLKYRSNSFILSFLSLFLYVKLIVQRNPPPTWSPHPADHDQGGAWLLAQGVVAIFHSHLQFCLDVTQAKPAKP